MNSKKLIKNFTEPKKSFDTGVDIHLHNKLLTLYY